MGVMVDVLTPIDGIWYSGQVVSLFDNEEGEYLLHVKFPAHETEEYKYIDSKYSKCLKRLIYLVMTAELWLNKCECERINHNIIQ